MSEDIITMQESARLVELERTIETGMTTFVEVGSALMEIRDSRLYRVEYKTFEAYCREKWGITDRHARNLIAASSAATKLGETGTMVPKTERQARPLATLAPEQQPQAWERAVEIAEGEQPTARQVEEAVAEFNEADEAVDAPETEDPNAPSEGLHYADKAIRCLERIQHNDKERARAHRRVKHWLQMHRA
jgi:hypothetical protein